MWSDWADKALKLMNKMGILAPDERRALMETRKTGLEPYHTLKSYVGRLESQHKNELSA